MIILIFVNIVLGRYSRFNLLTGYLFNSDELSVSIGILNKTTVK